MANNVQTYTTRIFLNDEEAKKRLDELQKQVEELRKKKEAAAKGGDWPTFNNAKKQLDMVNKEMNSLQSSAQKIDKVLDSMSTAGIKDLQSTIKAINKELESGSVKRGSDEWIFLNEQLRRCRSELQGIRADGKAAMPAWQKFSKFLNDSWGGLTMLIGTFTGITMTIRKTVQDFAKMEEAMADARKYTGLTDEAIRDLNEDLKKMNTRTSREELNELAGAAGRLGKTSKQDILDFVEAGNMIKVALGDDLGEGAIDKVGKLAMAFGEDEKKGLRGAMLATGSAVNELAQNSSAQAGYLVDFTARVAGFGKQLGLTQAQIMGFGAVMDENLLRDEMAATAFGNMLTKMQTDTEKFAKIAGKGVKEFTDLLNKDANAAIFALADSLKKADPQTMMKMLDDMGLDGNRAVGVLSTLADKIDDVRQRQQLATKAYQEATSVGKEYDTMNNTVEAGIEKAKKQFNELAVDLGEKLLPVVKYTITNSALLVKGLSLIAGVVSRNFGLISRLALLIGGYTAAMTIATNATKIWAAVVRLAPWGIAITSFSTIIGLIDHYKTKTEEARKKSEELYDTEARAVTQYSEEAREIKKLDKIMRDETVSIGQRREALDKLKAIIPDYNGMLDEEGRLTKDNKKAIDDYLISLQKQIRLKAYKDKLEELYKRQGEQEDAQRDASDKYWSARQTNTLQGTRNSVAGKLMDFLGIGEEAGLKRNLDKADKDLADTNGKIESLKKKIADVGELADKEAAKADGNQGGRSGGSANYVSDSILKKQEQERKKLEEEERRRLKEAEDAAKAESDARIADKMHEYAMGKTAYRQYIQEMAALQMEGLKNRRDVYEKGSVEYERLNRQMEERSFRGDQQVNQMKLEDLRRCMLLQKAEIEMQAVREEITEDEKLEKLRTLNETYLADKVELYKEGSLERMRAEWELQDTEQRNQLEREARYQQLLQQTREQYLGMSNERQLEMALSGLDELHDKGLLKEEEFQRARIAIQAQYANSVSPTEQNKQTGSQMLANARENVNKNAQESNTTYSTPFVGAVQQYQATMEQLKELYANDKENYAAYQYAKQQATAEFCADLASQFQAAYNSINQVMSAASSYFSAAQEYETAQVKKKYEKQIAAAGNNQKRVKKLQEKQAKEEAAIKSKYNKRAVNIQIAQAIAQTAIGALNAYSSAAAIPIVGTVLAPIAAAAAVAAGMIQVAAIKKQAQAQEAGYYSGGYTGGRQYRKEAGVVHQGEFVANHQAVENPNVRPMLDFIDKAQRNNTVGSLTAEDISRQLGQGGSAVVTPIVNIQNDNEEMRQSLDRNSEATEALYTVVTENGIKILFPMDSFDREYKHFTKLNDR